MPEGDTVFRAAAALHTALAGKVLRRSDFRVPRYATVDLSVRMVDEAIPRGKHLLIRAGDAVVHSHLKMEGAWHVYKPGQRWRRPGFQARAVLTVDGAQAVGFDLGILEVIERSREDDAVGHLGPDLLGPDWDPALAAANLARDGERPIGLALLDQSVMAGVGNVYRSELCFLRGVHPATPVAAAGDPSRWAALAQKLLDFNKNRVARVTTGDLRRRLWVYGREGRPCLRCGGTIEQGELGEPARVIYWCPHCQPLR